MNQQRIEENLHKYCHCYRSRDNLGIIGTRHRQCFLLFWGVAIAFAFRVNLSVAIVAMTDSTEPYYETYEWDETTKSLILSSFFWGYLINQIPGGQLSKRYGAKYTMIFSIFLSSIFTIITPFMITNWNWYGLLIIRFLEGCVQGVLFPSVHTFISKWALIEERGRFSIYIYSGMTFGMFIMLIISGEIAANLGWSSIFYISGLIGILWCILWQIYGASTPEQHTTITNNEKTLIQESLGHTEYTHRKYIPTPWFDILKSVPFFALLISQCCQLFGFTMLLTESPTYLNGIFEISINKNAFLSSLPYLGRFILEYLFVGIEYRLSHNYQQTQSHIRKTFNTIGQFVPAVCLTILGFISSENLGLAVSILVVALSGNGANGLGCHINHIDLSSNHAGTLMGICNFFAGICGLIAPIVVGLIVTDTSNQNQWQIVYIITSAVMLFGGTIFLVFGSTKTQHWNEPILDATIADDPDHTNEFNATSGNVTAVTGSAPVDYQIFTMK